MRGERLGQRNTGIIITNHADKDAARAKRYQIAGDVAGAANHDFGTLHRDHRRRRLRRNARHVAVDELVEHQIADAKHGLRGQIGQVFFEIKHHIFLRMILSENRYILFGIMRYLYLSAVLR